MERSDLSTLTWTTRAGVASKLARFLRDTVPGSRMAEGGETSLRVRAAELLTILAVPSQRSLLRALALDRAAEVEVRHQALSALERLGVGLSGPDLESLLTDDGLCEAEEEDEDPWFGAQDLLTLARRSDAQSAARRYLLSLSPEDRTQLLAKTRLVTPAALMEWMYAKWLNEDRHLLADDRVPHSANQWVIRMTLERLGSRAVLQEMWRAAEGKERSELLDILHDDEVEWEFPGKLSAAETSELAEALALPTEALVAHHGRERLLELIENRLVAEQTRHETESRLRKLIEHDSYGFVRMLRVLRHWQDPVLDEWIAARALGAQLHENVRCWLMEMLWRRNRAMSATAVMAALAAGEPLSARMLVKWSALAPVLADWPMLREATRPFHRAELQYYGLCGLECLGESGDTWREQLIAWTHHPDSRLQIRALGGLARRGDADARQSLLEWAEGHHPVHARAEAVAVLAELDAPGHLSLLTRALADCERPELRSRCAPVAEEAALALARIGTPEALTSLLRSHLTTEFPFVQGATEQYLTAIVDAKPGTSPVICPPTPEFGYWRHETHPRWTEPS